MTLRIDVSDLEIIISGLGQEQLERFIGSVDEQCWINAKLMIVPKICLSFSSCLITLPLSLSCILLVPLKAVPHNVK